MPDLPPDVRDRAEIAAYQAYVHIAPGPQSDRWGTVVDAVTEVLAAHFDPMDILDANEKLGDAQVTIARALGITESPYSINRIMDRVAELRARVT